MVTDLHRAAMCAWWKHSDVGVMYGDVDPWKGTLLVAYDEDCVTHVEGTVALTIVREIIDSIELFARVSGNRKPHPSLIPREFVAWCQKGCPPIPVEAWRRP